MFPPLARTARRWAGSLLLALGLLLPAASPAAVPIAELYAGPITADSDCTPDGRYATPAPQAGGRPDFCVAYRTDTPPPSGDDLRRLVVDTPLGFVGSVAGRPTCSAEQFGAATSDEVTCPAGAQIGDAFADITVALSATSELPLEGVPGRVYNLPPSTDELARIGLVLDPPTQPHVKVVMHVLLRPAPDVGLRTVIDPLPEQVCMKYRGVLACDHELATQAVSLRFWGSPADHPTMPSPFTALGADCSTDQVTRLNATTYTGETAQATATYRLTGCEHVPFGATLSLATADQRTDVPTAATVGVSFATGNDEQVASPPQRAVVTLPDGLTLAAQIASGDGGLPTCSAAQFARTSGLPDQCPQASAIATVEIRSPLLDAPLTGRAFVGAQSQVGALPDLYIEAALSAAADAPRVKLVGQLAVGDDGRIVTTLDDLPQMLVSQFTLSFRGGPHAALVTPQDCRRSDAVLVTSPRSGGAALTATASYGATSDCEQMRAFSGSLAFASSQPVAGGSGIFTTTIARPDRTQRLSHVVVDLPNGQIANLRGVPECPLAQARVGACSPASQVGGVAALSGVGPAPYAVTGTVYLTAREPGAVAGLAIHVPVKIGEIDLGTLDVLARVEIRPADLGLRIVADVPQFFRGLPLDVQVLSVALDRHGFARNPTFCGALAGHAYYVGSLGATATPTGGYQVAGCGALPFAPTFRASVTGETRPKGHPTLTLQIASADGSAALASTSVMLPEGVGVDLKQIPRACAQDAFRAGTCAPQARIGTLSGSLAITDEPLTGYLYLLKPPTGSVLPGLGLAFVGRFSGRIAGTSAVDAKTGRLITRFAALPDLPLTALQIRVTGGSGGPLMATEELCEQRPHFDVTLGGQNGASVLRRVRTVCGVPLAGTIPLLTGRIAKLRHGRPVLRIHGLTQLGRRMVRVDLTLPRGWSLRSQRHVRASRYARVKKLPKDASATIKRRSPRRLRITLRGTGAPNWSLLTRTGTIRVKKSSDRKTKRRVTVTARLQYRDGRRMTVPLLLTPR